MPLKRVKLPLMAADVEIRKERHWKSMIFEGLNYLRRNAIMTAIELMAFGIVLLILPEVYLPALIMAGGSVMIIISICMVFDFLSSNKALIHFIYLTGAIALGIGGIAVLIFQDDVIFVLGFFLGLFLVLGSIRGIFNSYVYARRSEIKGWWALIPLYAIQIVSGAFIMINPWWDDPSEFKQVIALVIIFASIVSALKLVWVWPLRKA